METILRALIIAVPIASLGTLALSILAAKRKIPEAHAKCGIMAATSAILVILLAIANILTGRLGNATVNIITILPLGLLSVLSAHLAREATRKIEELAERKIHSSKD